MKTTFIVTSSQGQIEAEKESGRITKITTEKGADRAFRKAILIDTEEFKKYYAVDEMPDSVDILDVGYWIKDGAQPKVYEPPVQDWRNEVALMRKEATNGND